MTTATESNGTGAANIGQPAVHERDLACERAGVELWGWLPHWRARHALTDGELVYLLAVALGRSAQSNALNERKRIEEIGK